MDLCPFAHAVTLNSSNASV